MSQNTIILSCHFNSLQGWKGEHRKMSVLKGKWARRNLPGMWRLECPLGLEHSSRWCATLIDCQSQELYHREGSLQSSCKGPYQSRTWRTKPRRNLMQKRSWWLIDRNMSWHGRRQQRMHTKRRVLHTVRWRRLQKLDALSNDIESKRSRHEDEIKMAKVDVKVRIKA